MYQVSSLGRVKSSKGNEKILKQIIEPKGYCAVMLYKKGNVKKVRIHRLVAETFIPNLENKPTVNHKNGIKTDNKVENWNGIRIVKICNIHLMYYIV